MRDERYYKGQTRHVLACSMGNCNTAVIEDTKEGERQTVGSCKAADYCLRQAFQAVDEAPSVDEGRLLYREIMNTCEGFPGGNYCPKIDCGLSAGVSEDQIPGTAGECIVEIRSPQGQLFDPSEK